MRESQEQEMITGSMLKVFLEQIPKHSELVVSQMRRFIVEIERYAMSSWTRKKYGEDVGMFQITFKQGENYDINDLEVHVNEFQDIVTKVFNATILDHYVFTSNRNKMKLCIRIKFLVKERKQKSFLNFLPKDRYKHPIFEFERVTVEVRKRKFVLNPEKGVYEEVDEEEELDYYRVDGEKAVDPKIMVSGCDISKSYRLLKNLKKLTPSGSYAWF